MNALLDRVAGMTRRTLHRTRLLLHPVYYHTRPQSEPVPDSGKPDIGAVVVTYNRLEKLKTVLKSLESQTLLPSCFIIIDNASTDGTQEFLKQYEKDFPLKGKVRLVIRRLDENVGGAGGFSAGMRVGYEEGCGYVWIFDDDGYPQPHALERLYNGYRDACRIYSPDIPFACSMVKFIDGTISEMNNPVTTWDWGRLQALGLSNAVLVSSCSFVSVLIPRWVMECYGLPYKEYFIWYDDAEYTQRISAACPGIEVTNSVVLHDMGQNKGVNYRMVNGKNLWKFRYGARNQASFWLHHHGVGPYLTFCLSVVHAMIAGHVSITYRWQIYRKLLEAIRFNPSVDFPQEISPALEDSQETASASKR